MAAPDTDQAPGAGESQPAAEPSNRFLDRGFDAAESYVLEMRLQAMLHLQRHLAQSGWTQAEAARRMGVTQPRVSKLKKGHWQEFSLDMLLTLGARVGLRAELHLHE